MLPPYHQAGVGNGAFDKGLGSHPRGRVDAVQPALVVTQPLPHPPSREESYMAPHRSQSAPRLEMPPLSSYSIAAHQIIGIHARHDRPRAMGEPRVQRTDKTLMGNRNDLEARIVPGKRLRDHQGVIFRTVIDNHALPARFSLAPDTFQAGRKGVLHVEAGKEDGDERLQEIVRSLTALIPSTSIDVDSLDTPL